MATMHASTSTANVKGHTIERHADLMLEADVMSTLDYWHVVHKIDNTSPLWPLVMSGNLPHHLKSIEISLTAYDPSFNQPIKLYMRYAKHEILHRCHFEQVCRRQRARACICSRYGALCTP